MNIETARIRANVCVRAQCVMAGGDNTAYICPTLPYRLTLKRHYSNKCVRLCFRNQLAIIVFEYIKEDKKTFKNVEFRMSLLI